MLKKVLKVLSVFLFLSFIAFLFVNFFFVEKTLTDWKDTISSEELSEKQLQPEFQFVLTSDIRNFVEPEYTVPEYSQGGFKFINSLDTDFMIVAGDLDPVNSFHQMVDKYLGEEYKWYPVVGNHELPNQGNEDVEGGNIEFIRSFDVGEVTNGPEPCPETTYSFDYMDVHFIILNQYCDREGDTATDGKISEILVEWLENDLDNSFMQDVIVIGHEPAFVFPDEESYRLRHEDDSLNQYPESRDEFWTILEEYEVEAYLCGHTHNFSSYEINDVWQIDAGHMRGIGDTGSLSTVVLFKVYEDYIEVNTYKADVNGRNYSLFETIQL